MDTRQQVARLRAAADEACDALIYLGELHAEGDDRSSVVATASDKAARAVRWLREVASDAFGEIVWAECERLTARSRGETPTEAYQRGQLEEIRAREGGR